MAQQEIDFSKFYPESTKILKIVNMKNEIHIFMKSLTHMQTCPACKKECNEYNSTYHRKIQDLPIFKKTVYIHLTAYRYYCHNSECKQKVFCETVDGFFGFKMRISADLNSEYANT